jgi:hypothetical protein
MGQDIDPTAAADKTFAQALDFYHPSPYS